MKIVTFFFILIYAVSIVQSEITAVKFTLYEERVAWDTAKSRCEAAGQGLAVLDTADKLAALKEQISLTNWTWIGFHEVNNNDNYVWLNGNPLPDDDANWHSGEPDDVAQNCGLIRNHRWSNGHCTCALGYICETELCPTGYKMLADGSCCEQKRSAIYVMKKRNMGIISDNLISAQVRSKIECGMECVQRNCDGFSFQQKQSPDIRMCHMTMTVNVTQLPLEEAQYYIKP